MPAAKALPPPLTADEEGRRGRAAAEEGRGASCEEDGSAGRRRLISEEKEKGEGEKIEKRESILESNVADHAEHAREGVRGSGVGFNALKPGESIEDRPSDCVEASQDRWQPSILML